MPCPWFKDGMCHSPKIGKPSAAIVNKKCTSDNYEECKFYVPPEATDKGLSAFVSEERSEESFEEKYKPYKLIHASPYKPESKCPHFEVMRGTDGKWYALCKVMDRLLTVVEMKLCEHHWKTCPFYKNAVKLLS
ncbi:hypothetical protein EYM_05625 [Ignicoccus islandicus DSM 13165]|uniref:Uncharacterized protein n=1 Tax=Ignicoccus islandicus DSM 13165 TaxID=940295 RepID=A0A0U3E3W3_9CREN|nr:hypothetical protein [Ignicoccus islandicus]ALU12603.1 hypothetical protein EYM_05625 [Ignicoccus islandicus DSM 13165]